jgi:hypothetical protein
MSDLVPIPVPGTDREIMAAQIGGAPLVSLRHSCESIGIATQAQLTKLRSKTWARVTMSVTRDSSGRDQELAMIDRRTFTMWLATIDTRRVSPDARPIIEAFQAEAADALDAYFNEGGAINPRATEDQLERITREAQAQAGVLRALKGVVDPKHLEAKGRVILARAMGEAPELDPSTTPLYVWDFLRSKGLKRDMVEAKAKGFGTRLSNAYVKKYDYAPQKHHQQLSNGTVRQVNAYTEADRPLFESVWARHYEGVVADSALTLIPGGEGA